jgi:hypothetical protein
MIPNLIQGALIALFGGALAFSVGAIAAELYANLDRIVSALLGRGE